MVYNFFHKKSFGSNILSGAITHRNKSAIKIKFMSNQRSSDLDCAPKGYPAKEYPSFKDNIYGAVLSNM